MSENARENRPPVTKIIVETSLDSSEYDGVLLVTSTKQSVKTQTFAKIINNALKLDASLETEIAVLPLSDIPAGRLVHSPTGPIDSDYDDLRVFKKSAAKGMKRALRAGITKPLLVLESHTEFENAELATLLGALEALYVPIQIREHDPSKRELVEYLGVYSDNASKTKKLADEARILESGRRVACDIGDADPERMTPLRIKEYIQVNFRAKIDMHFIENQEDFLKDYPLFEAVNRAASTVPRHQGLIAYMTYEPSVRANVKETLFLVGKGVTYDTGGSDLKVNGAMAGMSRDKCGAAAVLGFMEIVKLVQPENLKVVAAVSLVRNSIGSNGYVADEVITARSGARVRVVNTDAEGRMVMADVLCRMKEMALDAVNPHLYTVATLTGHAFLTVGEGYSIVLDNGPSRKSGHSSKLQTAGDRVGDPFEISTIRRDDLDFHKGVGAGDDVKQANLLPSTRTPRGHQGPAAFLILASGLDKHGSGSEKPLKFSHLDIAASAGEYPKPATGSPVLALAKTYLLK